MKNIHLFEAKDAYDAEKSSLILPRVAYITENQDVKYNPFNANGHDFVEIAGIKWATMNVGATSITDTGLYFQWGDTQGYTKDEIEKEHKKKFASDWSDYKFTTDGGKTFTKYNETDNKIVLDLDDDAVQAAWGGSWRMPTEEEMQTIHTSTAVTWTKKNGYEIHDNNSEDTLYLPICGYANNGTVSSKDYYGTALYSLCWSSTLKTNGVSHASYLCDSSFGSSMNNDFRCVGLCVRGVLAEN